MEIQRIDVHTHIVPSFWAAELANNGGDPSGWKAPEWTPELHHNFMDDNQIQTSILSLTAPSVAGWPEQDRRDITRKINEYVAELVKNDAQHFGNFATLPLPDIDGAVEEARYALEVLRADGVVVLTNYTGVYLGDKRYHPLWEVLNQYHAVVFIHPGFPLINQLPELPGPIVDYPFDSTRNAVHMVTQGVLDKFPQIKFILSHAGGFLPYAAMRFSQIQATVFCEQNTNAEQWIEKFQRFYFDTALSAGPYAFPSLLEFAQPERILFGSDFPYASAEVAANFTNLLDHNSGLNNEQKNAINQANALKLFPRLQ